MFTRMRFDRLLFLIGVTLIGLLMLAAPSSRSPKVARSAIPRRTLPGPE